MMVRKARRSPARTFWAYAYEGVPRQGEDSRNATRILFGKEHRGTQRAARAWIGAILLIVAGALGLVYGTFSRNKETRHTSVGPMELSVSGQRTAEVPVWAGVGAIVVGGVVLLARKKSKG